MRKPAMAMVVALCIGGGAMACSDSKGDTKSTTTTTVSFCDDRDALRTSVDKLKNVNVVEDGTSALNSAVSEVGQAVDALAKSGKSEIQPQVDAVKSSLSKLESAIGDASSSGLAPVATAAGEVATAAGKLVTEVEALPCD